MNPSPTSPESVRFDERFDELAGIAYRVAFRIVGHREEARDIAQEALARAYSRWPQVQARAPAWVGRVSTNLALDHVRRAGRRRTADAAGLAASGGRTDLAERTDLIAALRSLPRRQRDVVVLRFLADFSEAEVAAALGLAAGTVKSHAHRGLASLRRTVHLHDGGTDVPPGSPAGTGPDPGRPATTTEPTTHAAASATTAATRRTFPRQGAT